jgi:uncharacterized protein YheU (UPF0270 family)
MRKYFYIEKLDAPTLNAIVNKIVVHEGVSLNGKKGRWNVREQKVDIYYNFVGVIG